MPRFGTSGRARRAALTVALAALPVCLWSAAASAQCGGLCIYEVGTPQMGESYAGAAATADDAATAFLNPAGMTRLDKAELLSGIYGATFNLSFDQGPGTMPPPPILSPPGSNNSGGNAGSSFLPGLGSYLVVPLSDEDDLRFGLAINGLFGGAADYRDNWVGRFFVTDVSLTILNINPSIAWRLTDWLSIGGGLNYFYGTLGKYQLINPASGAKLKADGADDWQPSFSAGVLLEPFEGTRIGVTYRYEVNMNLTGGDAPNFSYEFSLPQGVNVAIRQQVTPKLALLADGGWSNWSGFSQQSIVVGPVDESFNRQWHDTWRAAGGLEYQLDDAWRLTAGVSYDSSPVNSSHRTPDLPVSEQYRFSAGVQHTLRENLALGLTYTFLWFDDPHINNVTLPGPVATVLDGKYSPSWGQFVGLTLRWTFCSPLPWASCPHGPPPSEPSAAL